MSSISRSHIIDVEADKVLRAIIPNEWLIRKQDPDFHVDFRIEIADKEPTGRNFCVQLKGHEAPKVSGLFCVQPMKTKHLIYYVDKIKEPIFLFIANTTLKEIYWLFLQEYLLNLPSDDWRARRTCSIKVPLDSVFTDPESFIQELEKAEAFMRDRWPGNIQPTMHYHQKQLHNLDPRFKIDIQYVDGQTSYNLHTNTNVNINFRFKNSIKNKDKLTRLISHGEPISIPHTDLLIEGSPLFDYFTHEYKGDVKLTYQKRMKVDVFARISAKKPLILHGFKAELIGGNTHFKLEICLPSSPFECSTKMKQEAGKIVFSGNMEFDTNLDNWNGYKISELPYISQISSIFQAFNDNLDIQFDVSTNGKPLFPIRIVPKKFPEFEEIFRYVMLLNKLNKICTHFEIDYLFEDVQSISDSDAALIHALCEFIDTGCMKVIVPKATVAATLILTSKLYRSLKKKPNPVESIKCTDKDLQFHLLGKKIVFSNIQTELQNMKLVTDLSELNEKQIGKEIVLDWVATESTVNSISAL
ncbi:MAG: DUF4365 domain-containing protein [Fibrobacter sp.]|nr:DUF4365 domain-containing protein [Fibrobacter sp.]